MSKTSERANIALDERLNRISDRIEGLRTGKIPLSVPVLRRDSDHHFWVDEEHPVKETKSD